MGFDHLQIEERSRVLHQAIAEILQNDPALLNVAKENLKRWKHQEGARIYWTEWEKILEGHLEEIIAFLGSSEERARWLRQSSPFCGILSPQERWKIYESFSA
jgi:hypothetical protein